MIGVITRNSPNVGLKKQVDLPKDILVPLPDVKRYPVIMKDIEEAFRGL